MFEARGHTPQDDAVDWRALADQIFPEDELRPTAAVCVFLGV
jgi:hypothetical protein